jgi:NAD(P)-dependent dehydrogenase (short-subunit alcohol dehydrogenase family)
MTVSLQNSVVFVTGANGGLGREFVDQALDRGATKVYASARSPREWDDPRIVATELDVTDESSVATAAAAAADTTIVINNAGISIDSPILTGDPATLRATFETNFFGPIAVARAFAPALARNGGGAILDVHSVLSWLGVAGAYSASKAAFWSATNSLRLELAQQGTLVTGLHLGYADTPMAAHIETGKIDPADVVRLAYAGLEAGEYEVLADQLSADIKQRLSGPIEAMYPQLRR